MGVKELKMKKKKKSVKKKLMLACSKELHLMWAFPTNPAWGANINLFFLADFFLLMSDFTEREDCL